MKLEVFISLKIFLLIQSSSCCV